MGDGSADLSRLVYPRRSGGFQSVFGVGATWRPSRSGMPYSICAEPVDCAKLIEQSKPLANKNQAATIGAALGDRRSIESTILKFIVVLHTLHALVAKSFVDVRQYIFYRARFPLLLSQECTSSNY